MKITYATNYDDWEGIYVDGVLKVEGHKIQIHDLFELFSDFSTVENINATDYLDQYGSLPYKLAELDLIDDD